MKTTTTTDAPKEPWLKKLEEKLPQFPDCGIDAQDRIFGGRNAAITDFPWAVLIEYDKGKNIDLEMFAHFCVFKTLLQVKTKKVFIAAAAL